MDAKNPAAKMDENLIEKEKMKKKVWDEAMVVCCKVFISEARNRAALEAIKRAAERVARDEAVIVSKFDDRDYNRVRYTVASYVEYKDHNFVYSPLQRFVVAMAEGAYEAFDLRSHIGAHPRLGVVDDVVFHPLARASLHEASLLANATARDIAARFQVPIYLYAAAHPTGKAPDAIRRELDYYRPNFIGNQWAGWTLPDILPEHPDVGPNSVVQSRGVCLVGACPWVSFFNVPILSNDLPAAKRIARAVSARGGGLPTVQTMCLSHGTTGSTEIACILLDPNRVGADRVQHQVEMLAAHEGLDVGEGYFTDHSAEMVVEKYMHMVSKKEE